MKYLRQFVIILGVSFLGEILRVILPLPVPASVYGLICMLLLLKSGILKVGQVKEVSKFLIEIMPVMFVPAAVGLIESWNSLREVLIPVAIIITVTTVFVMAVTGKVTQAMMNRKKKGEQYAGDYK
ncbi:MAG: CidA/LrgA family protein [Lachnospiraceae bacterium]|nr:CidA/LrgA family protein [Lachnospiraceae bacterium]